MFQTSATNKHTPSDGQIDIDRLDSNEIDRQIDRQIYVWIDGWIVDVLIDSRVDRYIVKYRKYSCMEINA